MKSIRNQFELLMILALIGIVPALSLYILVEQEIFLGLCWNVFLALLPFYFAIKVNSANNKWVGYFNTFLWLLFLPNAPYIITDLVHVPLNKGYEGFVFYLVAVLSFTGLLSWLFSVRMMLARLPEFLKRYKAIRQYGFHILCILSGIGVAMGRFARLNSWEVFYKPEKVVIATLHMYSNFFPWIITIAISLILYSMCSYKFKGINLFSSNK